MSNKSAAGPRPRDGQPAGGLDAVAGDPDAMMAMVIAMATRNGVEDLHASGAFSDKQAPGFNRRVRGRVYEALLALRYRDDAGDNPFSDYLTDLLVKAGTVDELEAAVGADVLCAAVQVAVSEFAAAEQLDASISRELERTATQAAMIHAIRPMRALPDQQAMKQLAYLVGMIPRYWEPPQVSKRFAALLDEVVL